MNDDDLYDLNNAIGDVEPETINQEIALLQVRAIASLATQVNQLGVLIEELITPSPSRWARIKGWIRR